MDLRKPTPLSILVLLLAWSLLGCGEGQKTEHENRPPAEGFVASHDGLKVYYKRSGTCDTSMVFVHGWCINGSYFDAPAAEISKRFTVVQLDLGGHGRSGKDRKYWTPENLAADVKAVADHLGLQKIMLVGHSMGDVIVTEAAHLLGDRVIALYGIDTFISPGADWDAEEGEQFRAALRADLDQVIEEWIGGNFHPAMDSSLRAEILHDMKGGDDSIRAEVLINIGEYLEAGKFGPRLAALDMPVTTFNAVPVQDSLWEAEGVRITMVPLEGVGHYPMREDPEQLTKHLMAVFR